MGGKQENSKGKKQGKEAGEQTEVEQMDRCKRSSPTDQENV